MKRFCLLCCSIISLFFTIFFGYFFVTSVVLNFIKNELYGNREGLANMYYGAIIFTPFLLISMVSLVIFLIFTIKSFKNHRRNLVSN